MSGELTPKLSWRIGVAEVAVLLGILLVAGLGLVWYVGYRYEYPYGWRIAYLPGTLQSLRLYAMDHEGRFPEGTNSYEALRQLYPDFLEDVNMFAGISGDRAAVAQKLRGGEPIGSNECSWVYFPGFRTDDGQPNLMLIYERASGVTFNGMRMAGRVVGLLDGTFRQIPDEQWNTFLAEQERLRREVLRKRQEVQ